MTNIFSEYFRAALRKKYGRLPSAAFLAIQFNRLIASDNCVSQETARRWMRGVSMPKYSHLNTLAIWLSMDINVLLSESGISNFVPSGKSNLIFSDRTMELALAIEQLPAETSDLLFRIVPSLRAS